MPPAFAAAQPLRPLVGARARSAGEWASAPVLSLRARCGGAAVAPATASAGAAASAAGAGVAATTTSSTSTTATTTVMTGRPHGVDAQRTSQQKQQQQQIPQQPQRRRRRLRVASRASEASSAVSDHVLLGFARGKNGARGGMPQQTAGAVLGVVDGEGGVGAAGAVGMERSVRKPNGYWNELANVEKALVEVNQMLGGARAGRKIVPMMSEMRRLGRNDLIAALAKHGGMKAVADLLGWSLASGKGMRRMRGSGTDGGAAAEATGLRGRARGAATATRARVSSSRKATAARERESVLVAARILPGVASSPGSSAAGLSSANAVQAVGVRRAKPRVRITIPRRPKNYWDDFEKVKSSIFAFIAEYGTPGQMPTGREFIVAGHGALKNAAQRHGGLIAVAEAMGLRSRKAPKKKNTWSNKAYFQKMLLQFVEQHDPGVMPTANELKEAGENQLANAVTNHGGYPAVARELGLIVRGAKEVGAPEVWGRDRLAEELRTFTATFYPSLALANRMPSESQLRRCGRNDLCYAIAKWGGYKKVQDQFGFAPRPVGPRPVPRRMASLRKRAEAAEAAKARQAAQLMKEKFGEENAEASSSLSE